MTVEAVVFDLGGVLAEFSGVATMRELAGIASDEELWQRIEDRISAHAVRDVRRSDEARKRDPEALFYVTTALIDIALRNTERTREVSYRLPAGDVRLPCVGELAVGLFLLRCHSVSR